MSATTNIRGAETVRKIPHLRWWITGLLFLSTVINYMDRQTLSVLARTIQDDLAMSDVAYAHVVQAFLLAYALSYLLSGRFTDWLGTRLSMACFIVWWSIANMLTGLSRSAISLGAYRFLLGVGEPGNYTAAPKALSEWFKPAERGLAYGIYTAGATLGATLAPPLIAYGASRYGWRAAFVFTGGLGLLWVIPWLLIYRKPAEHPRITLEERALIPAAMETSPEAAQQAGHSRPPGEWQRWQQLLGKKETGLILLIRMLTDPVWYFYLFWFPKYLQDARHLTLIEVGAVAWIVYLAADVGSVLSGWVSGRLIKRGLSPIASRKRVMTVAACGLPLSPLIAFAPSTTMAVVIAAVVALAHLSFQATGGAMVVDLYPSKTLATAFGLIAAGSALGGLISTHVVGQWVTNYSYTPVFMLMGALHPLALLLLWRIKDNA